MIAKIGYGQIGQLDGAGRKAGMKSPDEENLRRAGAETDGLNRRPAIRPADG